MALFDEATYRVAMSQPVTKTETSRVVVGIEVDNSDLAFAVHIGESRNIRVHQCVFSADDQWLGSRFGDLTNQSTNRFDGAVG